MDRRTYIYTVTPLFVFLNCGELLVARLGATMALVVASVAVLSILPQLVFYVSQCTQPLVFSETPFWGTLYALLWLGCLGTAVVTVLPDTRGTGPLRDPVFLLLIPLAIFCSVSGFLQYYPYFSSSI